MHKEGKIKVAFAWLFSMAQLEIYSAFLEILYKNHTEKT